MTVTAAPPHGMVLCITGGWSAPLQSLKCSQYVWSCWVVKVRTLSCSEVKVNTSACSTVVKVNTTACSAINVNTSSCSALKVNTSACSAVKVNTSSCSAVNGQKDQFWAGGMTVISSRSIRHHAQRSRSSNQILSQGYDCPESMLFFKNSIEQYWAGGMTVQNQCLSRTPFKPFFSR